MLNSYEKIDRLFAWTLDLENRFTFMSPRVKEILGYDSKDMMFKTAISFMPSEEGEELLYKINFYKENLTHFWTLKYNFLKKDGNKVLLEINGVAVYDKDRNICGYEGITYEV